MPDRPIIRPAAYLDVMKHPQVRLQTLLRELANTPRFAEQVIVFTETLKGRISNPGQRSDKKIQSSRIRMNKQLLTIAREGKYVLRF